MKTEDALRARLVQRYKDKQKHPPAKKQKTKSNKNKNKNKQKSHIAKNNGEYLNGNTNMH